MVGVAVVIFLFAWKFHYDFRAPVLRNSGVSDRNPPMCGNCVNWKKFWKTSHRRVPLGRVS
jgi:hypothetical protein